VLVASNRGPYRFEADPSAPRGFVARPAAGGVASALRPLLVGGSPTGERATWVAMSTSASDRDAVAAGAVREAHVGTGRGDGLDLVLLDFDPDLAQAHYDDVSNSVLWFLHHGMFDLVREPTFGSEFARAWDAYRAVNRAFADAIDERAAPGEAVLIQDYHLALTPGMLRERRPDLRVAHFTHTPFCGPNSVRVLPDRVATELLGSMAAVPCGFHTGRWAAAYTASVRTVLGDAAPPTFTASLGPDPAALLEIATSSAARAAGADLDAQVGDRTVIVRVDRVEPSKNIVRGFLAYTRFLELHPEWHGKVMFVALLNPSRETLPAYTRYAGEVADAAAAVNARWGSPNWQPVIVDSRDDYARSIAGLARADVVLVNPIKDGLNLVAKEAPIVNDRDAVLCCSPEAGAFDELGDACVTFHPYDADAGAAAFHTALTMGAPERAERAARLRARAMARTPRDWLGDQLVAAG